MTKIVAGLGIVLRDPNKWFVMHLRGSPGFVVFAPLCIKHIWPELAEKSVDTLDQANEHIVDVNRQYQRIRDARLKQEKEENENALFDMLYGS